MDKREIRKTMRLLQIEDVTTKRQLNNGTIVWRLPIKNSWKNGKQIEVASFSTGYVRNQNSGYSNYQLNKRCESEPQYYPVHEWCDKANDYIKTDKFRQYTTRSCVLIPNEIDRLEYLIGYCLKNYYIKRANQVADGKYVSKWEHEYKLKQVTNHTMNCKNSSQLDLECKVRNLETKYQASQADLEQANSTYSENTGAMERINDLENKLATIERIARINASYR